MDECGLGVGGGVRVAECGPATGLDAAAVWGLDHAELEGGGVSNGELGYSAGRRERLHFGRLQAPTGTDRQMLALAKTILQDSAGNAGSGVTFFVPTVGVGYSQTLLGFASASVFSVEAPEPAAYLLAGVGLLGRGACGGDGANGRGADERGDIGGGTFGFFREPAFVGGEGRSTGTATLGDDVGLCEDGGEAGAGFASLVR